MLEPRAQALAGQRQPLRVRRLQQIVDRALLEGADRVFVVGGDEDHMDLAGQRPGRLDAVHPGHADVEKDDVGFQALHHGDRLAAIAGLADDQELGPGFLQAVDDLFAHQALIVGDDGGGGGQGLHAGARPIRPGRGRGNFVGHLDRGTGAARGRHADDQLGPAVVQGLQPLADVGQSHATFGLRA